MAFNLSRLAITMMGLYPLMIEAKALKNGEIRLYRAPISEEKCLILDHIPNASYSKKDLELEKKLCDIDFHNTPDVALCAKTWSTSPGIIVYDVKSTNLKKEEFEQNICNKGKTKLAKKLAKFKTTMWEKNTSSTYHKSSLAYYHLSRFLNTSIIVPVSVYREIDQSVHENLSVQGNSNTKSGAIKEAWIANIKAHKNKETYFRSDIFFNDDKSAVQGILTKDSGEDAGALVDGINSAWGRQSTIDFSETPAFLALKNNKEINTAIRSTLNNYHEYIEAKLKKHSKGIFNRGNPEVVKRLQEMKKGLSQISELQMKSWMNEISEMVILDTIFAQEDRNLNISSHWYKYTKNENGVELNSLDEKLPFYEITKIPKMDNQTIIHRLALNDNDAALLPGSTNFMKELKLIETIQHINPLIYNKLLILQKDFQKEEGTYLYFKESLLLTKRELDQLKVNIDYVTESLKKKCLEKNIYFDLQETKEILEGKIPSTTHSTNCVL